MANFLSVLLPHDLPEDWTKDHYVSPGGTEVGLTPKYGFNYLMEQVNNAQIAAVELAEALTSGLSHNLLDNSYLIDPVSRLNGYFVAADTEYYSDYGLLNPVDVTSALTPVRYVSQGHGIIVINGTEYYVGYSDMRKGYIHPFAGSYGFDRWWASACTVSANESGLQLVSTSSNTSATFRQAIPNPRRLTGRTVVLSALVTAVSGTVTMRMYKASGINGSAQVQMVSKQLSAGLNYIPVVISNDVGTSTYPYLLFSVDASPGAYITMSAVKLQLGTRQTLAYQDASNNWLLTNIPNKVMEAVKCNGAPVEVGGLGMIVTPEQIGLGTANVLADAEVI